MNEEKGKTILRVPYEGDAQEIVGILHNFLTTVEADEETVEKRENGGYFITKILENEIEFSISVNGGYIDIEFDLIVPAFTIARNIVSYLRKEGSCTAKDVMKIR